MSIKNHFYKKFVVVTLLAIAFLTACKDDEPKPKPELTISVAKVSFSGEGSTSEITVECNDNWAITNSATWLQINKLSGKSGTTTVQLTAPPNVTGSARSTIFVVKSDNGQLRRITVTQAYIVVIPALYPSYNTSPKDPDATGMSSTAVELAAKMNLGWNIGNTMEAWSSETGWGNPKIT